MLCLGIRQNLKQFLYNVIGVMVHYEPQSVLVYLRDQQVREVVVVTQNLDRLLDNLELAEGTRQP